jgi:hypothetical protein
MPARLPGQPNVRRKSGVAETMERMKEGSFAGMRRGEAAMYCEQCVRTGK